MEENAVHMSVERLVVRQNEMDTKYIKKPVKEETKLPDIPLFCKKYSAKSIICQMIPSIVWLSNYNWKEYLLKDIIAGCTVAVMNIPQGMAYALLGNVPPVVGIYMAFFPVIIYSFLGTSKHISMGSFAVICLMTGKVITNHATFDTNFNSTYIDTNTTHYTPMQVGTAVTFLVAIFQLLMYLFRLGIFCTLLSDTLISGFTASAAIHVFTSQIKDLLGIKIGEHNGTFQLIYIYIDIFQNLSNCNKVAVILSFFTIIILVINNEVLKPWISKRSIIPIPIELIVVLVGTLVSSFTGLDDQYNLKTVGHIDIGLPEPTIPSLSLLPDIALDSFIIAIIAYVISLSMALIFAQKLKYEIDANQELLAQGCGNMLGSFFSCLPFAASLSRSVIQQTVGGCTQLTSLVSSLILLFVLLWISPFFEPLPRCVLSSLIVVALKGVLIQALDIKKIWKNSKLDALIWIATYVTVILVEIDIGLLVGVICSIVVILLRGLNFNIYNLERIAHTDIYVDVNRYSNTENIQGVKIINVEGCINFINRTYLRKNLLKILEFGKEDTVENEKKIPNSNETVCKCFVILNLSGLHYVDPSGVQTIISLMDELQENALTILLSSVSGSVYDSFKQYSCKINSIAFPTVHDAVLFAQSKIDSTVYTIRL